MDTTNMDTLPDLGNLTKSNLTKYERDIINVAKASNSAKDRPPKHRDCIDHTNSPFDLLSIADYLRTQCYQQETLYAKLIEDRKQSSNSLKEKIMRERYPLTGPLAANANENGEERPRSAVFTPIHKLNMPKICAKYMQRNGLRKQLQMLENKDKMSNKRLNAGTPDFRRRFDDSPELRRRFDGTPDLRRRSEFSPELRRRFEGSPDLRKRYEGSPELRKRFDTPDIRKRFEGSPDFRRKHDASPEVRQRHEISPELRRRFECSPDMRRRFEASPELRRRVDAFGAV